MRNSKTLFKVKKATSIVMLLVTLLTITINLSSCSSNKEDVDKGVPTVATIYVGVVYDNKTKLEGATVIRPRGYIAKRIAQICNLCPHTRAGKVFVTNCNRHGLQNRAI
jgi:Fe-S-cluster-containing hydrogenase component 2